MHVLDLGCGRVKSSIFLAKEFDVQVWATDLWFTATENMQRIRAAGMDEKVFPIHADARSLPFAGEFFDAIIAIDSFQYFGTDDLYLNYLAHFAKPNAWIGICSSGLVKELDAEVPQHLQSLWTQDFWCLHSAPWWRRHWERTGLVDIRVADMMPDGWKCWLHWHEQGWPDNTAEIEALKADEGRNLGYVRVVAQRRAEVELQSYAWPHTLQSFPESYEEVPVESNQRIVEQEEMEERKV